MWPATEARTTLTLTARLQHSGAARTLACRALSVRSESGRELRDRWERQQALHYWCSPAPRAPQSLRRQEPNPRRLRISSARRRSPTSRCPRCSSIMPSTRRGIRTLSLRLARGGRGAEAAAEVAEVVAEVAAEVAAEGATSPSGWTRLDIRASNLNPGSVAEKAPGGTLRTLASAPRAHGRHAGEVAT